MKSSHIPQERRSSARQGAGVEGLRHKIMTSANQLTVLRMVLVPVFILLVVYGHLGLAILTFFLAGVTDMLDGLIARRFGQKTPLGTFLDPIADKLLLVSAFVVLSLDGLHLIVRIPLWLTITVISRDLILVLSVVTINLTIGRRFYPPSTVGKLTTVSQLALIMTVLVSNFLEYSMPGLSWLIFLTLALTLVSGLHYMFRGMRVIGQNSEVRP